MARTLGDVMAKPGKPVGVATVAERYLRTEDAVPADIVNWLCGVCGKEFPSLRYIRKGRCPFCRSHVLMDWHK